MSIEKGDSISSQQADLRADKLAINYAHRAGKGEVSIDMFELALDIKGLLEPLEEAGVIPKIKNPNPLDVEKDEEAHDQWWRKNPEAEEQFGKAISQREHALEQIAKEVVIGYLLGESLSQSIEWSIDYSTN